VIVRFTDENMQLVNAKNRLAFKGFGYADCKSADYS
jgi:hypothetical protein